MRFIFVLFSLFIFFGGYSQSEILHSDEVGKCYKDCNISHYPEHAQYDTTIVEIEKIPSSSNWVKRKADRNCLSQNPDDCMVWCLVDTPAVMDTIHKIDVIIDENLTAQAEVLCPEEASEELFMSIYNHLYANGYSDKLKKKDQKNFNKIRKAYTLYQMENQMPLGGLNMKTLRHMGLY